jgi:hypothetical protein
MYNKKKKHVIFLLKTMIITEFAKYLWQITICTRDHTIFFMTISEWLFFNAKWAIFQLCHGVKKITFQWDEDNVVSICIFSIFYKIKEEKNIFYEIYFLLQNSIYLSERMF